MAQRAGGGSTGSHSTASGGGGGGAAVLERGQAYSQPRDTGVGTHWGTQLNFAIAHLRRTHPHPVRLEDLALQSGVEELFNEESLVFQRFREHDRVRFDEKTGLYSYRPDLDIRSKADVLQFIKQAYDRGGGITLRKLRDSWPQAPQAVEELIKEGHVLVTRTNRDSAVKAVYWNEVNGPEGQPVQQEFRDLWRELKVPDSVDLPRELEAEGLSTMSSGVAPPPGADGKGSTYKQPGAKKKKASNRRIKYTNTHLDKGIVDLSKDYEPGAS